MWVAVAVLAVVSAGWVTLAVAGGAALTHESGVLIGLAMDARAGTFYRPLVGPAGYGGTRYGPVHVLLHWGLMTAGLAPIAAGHLLTLTAAAGLWAGMAVLIRQRPGGPAVPWAAAVAFPLLALASADTRYMLASIRPDVLPAALNVWGLVCVGRLIDVGQGRAGLGRGLAAAAAAGLFAVAILAKISAGFGVVAAVVSLAIARRFLAAGGVGVVTGLIVAIGAVGLNALSHGQLWANFHACGNATGRPPVTGAAYAAILREVFVTNDWTGSLLTLTAVAAWAIVPAARRGVAGVYLPVTIALTLPMYVTPGLSANHLIDVRVAAVLTLATATLATAADRRRGAWAAVVAVVVVVTLVPAAQRGAFAKAKFRRVDSLRRAVLRTAAAGGKVGPILSDNDMVPIAVGQRPFMLDQFMFPSVRAARPDAPDDLYRRLDERFFAAVIVRHDPLKPAENWAWGGARFAAELSAHYAPAGELNALDHLWIYTPKRDAK